MNRPLLAALALCLAASAAAQPAKDGPFRALGTTPAQLDATEPTSPNPFTALLLPDVRPDLDYWTAKIAHEGRARGQRRALRGLRSLPTARVRERERGRFNSNDDPTQAQFLDGLRAEDEPLVEISGVLEPVPLAQLDTVVTDRDEGETSDGTFNAWGIVLGGPDTYNTGIRVGAVIGDGTYGATSGDVDVFDLDLLVPNTYLSLAVETPESALDPVMALYDPEGYEVLYNDDYDGTDSRGGIFLSQPGRYRLYVWGYTGGAESPGLEWRHRPASGYSVGSTGAYLLQVQIIRPDADHYAVHLDAGDVLAVATASQSVTDLALIGPGGETRMLSRMDYSADYTDDAPLVSPSELAGDGRGLTAALVAPAAGVYTVAARGQGDYKMVVQVVPSGPQRSPIDGPEQIFVDFDGGAYAPAVDLSLGRASATLSPLADYLPRWGLTAEDEDNVIDAILGTLRQHLRDALREDVPGMGAFDLEILNSRDHADPGQGSGVARLVVGGDGEELGIERVFGIASSVDIGNFDRNDIAYILLGSYSDPATSLASLNQFQVHPSRTKAELIGLAVGFTAAHEAGHFFGLHHTHNTNDIFNVMDEGGEPLWFAMDIGRDGVFGPGDGDALRFREDVFQAYYPFSGTQQSPTALALSLAPSPPDDRLTRPEAVAAALDRVAPVAHGFAEDVFSARWLYGGPDGLRARPDAWDVQFASGSRVSAQGAGVEVAAGPAKRIRAFPERDLWAPPEVVMRATVARVGTARGLASAGFSFHNADGRDEHAHIQFRGPESQAYLGRAGWVDLGARGPAPGADVELALVVADGRATLFLDGEAVRTADGASSFEAPHAGWGSVGLTVNDRPGGSGAAFQFRDLEVLALNETTSAVTGLGARAALRSPGARAPSEAAESESTSSAPGQVLRGAISVAPVEVGPAGYVFTFGASRSPTRVRLAENGDVWVQPSGAETWRRDRPGEVLSLLGDRQRAVTGATLPEGEAAAALEALRRAVE